jgi:hypothetical protein
MNALATILCSGDGGKEGRPRADTAEVAARLEGLLESSAAHDVPPDRHIGVSLGDPLVLLLAQHRSVRIGRTDPFCPDEGCPSTRKVGTIQQLSAYLHRECNVPMTETMDMVEYFIAQMLPRAIRPVLTKRGNCVARQEWDGIRCHSPGCTHVHWKYNQMLEDINRHHKDLASDIRALGWFWGTMRDIMKRKPLMTIAEALGDGDVWKCRKNKCGHFFATTNVLRRRFSHAHACLTTQNWDANMRQIVLTWEIGARDERREAQRENGPQEDDEREEEIESRHRDRSCPAQAPEPLEPLEAIEALPQHQHSPQIQRPNLGLRNNPAFKVQRAEEERANREMRESRQEMIEKKKHDQSRMLRE